MSYLWRLLAVLMLAFLLTGCNDSSDGETDDTDESGDGSDDTSQSGETTENSQPFNLEAQAVDGEIVFTWDAVPEADSYNLYHATDDEFEPENYAAYDNGTLVLDVISPHTLSDLTNDTTYYAIVTAVIDADESTASNQVSATPEGPVVSVIPLNDTGIDWCAYDRGIDQDCPMSGFPGQDGDSGRDAQARAGTLSKVGGGAAGFDFTRLDASGNEVTASATTWSCVRDNHTGLTWEVKTTDGGLHDNGNTYSWYNPDTTSNGGIAGTQDGGSCTDSDCDTHGFAEAVNQESLCGASDWRLPTRVELISILHRGRVNPSIDANYFPNTASSNYWSARAAVANTGVAWIQHFGSGRDGSDSKSNSHLVRLVSGSGGAH